MKIKLLTDGGYGQYCAAGDILKAIQSGSGVEAYVPKYKGTLYFSSMSEEYVVLPESQGIKAWGWKNKETGELMQGAVATRAMARRIKPDAYTIVRVVIKEI